MRGRPSLMSDGSGCSQPKIDFDDGHAAVLLAHTRAVVRAAVEGRSTDGVLPAALHDAMAYGLFVTLRRQTQLRACRGQWGEPLSPLGPLLVDVAYATAVGDPRFPRITLEEVPLLSIDLSVMHSPCVIDGIGDDAVAAIEVGLHGLVIAHPQGRGLLLPNVATEAGWDAPTFLDHLAHKACLPVETWRTDPRTRLMTFQTRLMTVLPDEGEFDIDDLSASERDQLFGSVTQKLGAEVESGVERDPRDSPPALTRRYSGRVGLFVVTTTGISTLALAESRSLIELAGAAAGAIRETAAQKSSDAGTVARLAVLSQPIDLCADDYPDRHALLGDRVIVVRHGGQCGYVLPGRGPVRRDAVGEALGIMQLDPAQWRAADGESGTVLTALRAHVISVSQPIVAEVARAPAVAGRFYPDSPDAMNDALDGYLGVPRDVKERANFRAVMLPHAGWAYCGVTIGQALSRIDVPNRVVVIGPKHTPDGPLLSVASHASWRTPGGEVPVDTQFVKQLCDAVPDLACEPLAHRAEHGCEVLLPFLHRANPSLKVVPIVMGVCPFEQTEGIARSLAACIAASEGATLLVISSDMNHFAPDAETRRLDRLALDAMLAGDAARLYRVCTQNRISMCGLLAAVTVMQALSLSSAVDTELIDYRTSADAGGDAQRVVGYAGVVLR